MVEILLAVDGVAELPGVVPMMGIAPSTLRALVAEASSCFISRTLVQRWVCAFLAFPEPDTSLASLAFEVVRGLDHPNTNGERPYVDPVYLDLVKRFVEKIEGSGLTCDGLETLKLRCGLVGREPVLMTY